MHLCLSCLATCPAHRTLLDVRLLTTSGVQDKNCSLHLVPLI
jgi:hypothetical protein